MKPFLRLAAAASLAAIHFSGAASTVVTSSDIGSSFALNQWYLTNYRDTSTGYTSTTVAEVSGANPRSGNGSVLMSSTDGSGKADYAYTWGYDNARTLSTLNALSYDWYRASASTNSNLQQPGFRLLIDADGNAATTNDIGYLVWEQVYNGPGPGNAIAATDTWVSSNLIDGNFWQRNTSASKTIEAYDINLLEWLGGAHPNNDALLLSANTAVLGIEFGIGSGWSGMFTGNVDNVSFRFGTQDLTTFNFELAANAVPEPSSLALVGLALMGLVGMRRRRR